MALRWTGHRQRRTDKTILTRTQLSGSMSVGGGILERMFDACSDVALIDRISATARAESVAMAA
ncbi:hypothetical protein ACP6C9_33510, partial [Mycolicibacterium septicum]|uniref:hypothetical protein n=1 Tax=Mycolicibacterium septicum TaxID=98668 RepID=UPI003CF6E422